MTTVYFVRHVQAQGNIERTFQGAIDTPISAQGEIQCQNLRDFFKDICLDAVYTSPLKRAVATANAIADGRCPVITNENIKEINAGIWEGEKIDDLELKWPVEFETWQNHPWDFVIQGGESMEQVYNRCGAGIKEIIASSKDKTIAVVSHGCALRSVLANAMGYKLNQLDKVGWVRNAGITKMEFEEGTVPGVVVYQNKLDHLDQSTILYGGTFYSRGK